MSQDTEDTMSSTDSDVQALRAELKNLRADFVKITEILKDSARNRGADAADKIRATAERGVSATVPTHHPNRSVRECGESGSPFQAIGYCGF